MCELHVHLRILYVAGHLKPWMVSLMQHMRELLCSTRDRITLCWFRERCTRTARNPSAHASHGLRISVVSICVSA